MKKKCRVVMLPTEKASKLFIIDKNTVSEPPYLSFADVGGKVHATECYQPQYLYLISDDEIKEGDNVYSKHYGLGVVIEDNNPNYKGEFPIRVKYPNIIVPYFNDGGYSSDRKLIYLQDCKKVIASTDSSINQQLFDEGDKLPLPQIPESFIKAYVEANGIDEVMVEYVNSRTGKSDPLEWDENGLCDEWKLKLTDNNEIVISMVEEKVYDEKWLSELYAEKRYSRDEVVALINKHRKETYNGYSSSKWIEENL